MSEGTNNPSLRDLLAKPVTINVGPGSIDVTPMSWDAGCDAIQGLLPALLAFPLVSESVEPDSKVHRAGLWAGVLLQYKEEVAQFCAIASGQPLKDIKALQPTLMIDLVMGLVEVNADFFALSLSGTLVGAQERLARLMTRLAPVLAAAEAARVAAASTTPSSA